MSQPQLSQIQEQSQNNILARLSATLDSVNPIDHKIENYQQSKLKFSQFIQQDGYEESFTQLRTIQDEIRQEYIKWSTMQDQGRVGDNTGNAEIDHGSIKQTTEVAKDSEQSKEKEALLDENGLLLLQKMVQLINYLNDEASQLHKDTAVGNLSFHEFNLNMSLNQVDNLSQNAESCTDGIEPAKFFDSLLKPAKDNGRLHQNQLHIKLKKAELNLREKAQEIVDLQERNQSLQQQINEFKSQKNVGVGHSAQIMPLCQEPLDLIKSRIHDLLKSQDDQKLGGDERTQAHLRTQETSDNQKFRSFQSQFNNFQQQIQQYEEDKHVAQSKITELEQLIQQQFDIIRDYSNQIEHYDARGQQQNLRISVLQHDLNQLVDNKYRDSVVFMQKVEEEHRNDQSLVQVQVEEEQEPNDQQSLSGQSSEMEYLSARVGTEGFSSKNGDVSKRIEKIDVSGIGDVSKRIDRTYMSDVNDVSKRIDKTVFSGINDVSKRIDKTYISGIDVASKRVDKTYISGIDVVSKRIDKTYMSGIDVASKRVDKTYDASAINDVSKRIDKTVFSGLNDISRRIDRLSDNNNLMSPNKNPSLNKSKRIVQISDCTDIHIRSNSGAESGGTEMDRVAAPADKSYSDCTEICKRINVSEDNGQDFSMKMIIDDMQDLTIGGEDMQNDEEFINTKFNELATPKFSSKLKNLKLFRDDSQEFKEFGDDTQIQSSKHQENDEGQPSQDKEESMQENFMALKNQIKQDLKNLNSSKKKLVIQIPDELDLTDPVLSNKQSPFKMNEPDETPIQGGQQSIEYDIDSQVQFSQNSSNDVIDLDYKPSLQAPTNLKKFDFDFFREESAPKGEHKGQKSVYNLQDIQAQNDHKTNDKHDLDLKALQDAIQREVSRDDNEPDVFTGQQSINNDIDLDDTKSQHSVINILGQQTHENEQNNQKDFKPQAVKDLQIFIDDQEQQPEQNDEIYIEDQEQKAKSQSQQIYINDQQEEQTQQPNQESFTNEDLDLDVLKDQRSFENEDITLDAIQYEQNNTVNNDTLDLDILQFEQNPANNVDFNLDAIKSQKDIKSNEFIIQHFNKGNNDGEGENHEEYYEEEHLTSDEQSEKGPIELHSFLIENAEDMDFEKQEQQEAQVVNETVVNETQSQNQFQNEISHLSQEKSKYIIRNEQSIEVPENLFDCTMVSVPIVQQVESLASIIREEVTEESGENPNDQGSTKGQKFVRQARRQQVIMPYQIAQLNLNQSQEENQLFNSQEMQEMQTVTQQSLQEPYQELLEQPPQQAPQQQRHAYSYSLNIANSKGLEMPEQNESPQRESKSVHEKNLESLFAQTRNNNIQQQNWMEEQQYEQRDMKMERKYRLSGEPFYSFQDQTQQDFDIRLQSDFAERDFFKLTALALAMNQPNNFVSQFKCEDFEEMYARAKNPMLNGGQEIQFYQFHDWIKRDLAATTVKNTLNNYNTVNASPNHEKVQQLSQFHYSNEDESSNSQDFNNQFSIDQSMPKGPYFRSSMLKNSFQSNNFKTKATTNNQKNSSKDYQSLKIQSILGQGKNRNRSEVKNVKLQQKNKTNGLTALNLENIEKIKEQIHKQPVTPPSRVQQQRKFTLKFDLNDSTNLDM